MGECSLIGNWQAQAITMGNAKDFANFGLAIYTPREWLVSQGD